ncbi:MAG: glycosyltransferase family 2 protein [Elusimicrobiales bacterium]|nr:glycosyltransferase family 2 protein [Elusimicrobiales bacterium]
MPGADPKITAVVLNAAGKDLLLDCLRSLGTCSYGALDIIVVRNGPAEDSLAVQVRSASPRVAEVLFTGHNAGFAGGNNPGIKLALERGADYVLLLNDDTAVAPDFLHKLVAEAGKDPYVGMAGPRIFYFSEPEKIWFSGASFDPVCCSFAFPGADLTEKSFGMPEPAATDYVTGCCLLASRKLVESIGGLDESFFLYWEDSDWGLRAAAAGFKSVVVPEARIWHKVSVSSGGNDSPFKIYHKTRGQLLFCERHAPAAKKKLLGGFARDIAWLLFKSGVPDRFRRAAAYAAGITGYLSGEKGPGPAWLKTENK